MTFLEEIKKPFNIITLALTIFSIALSVVFYYNGKKEKSISYQINEPTALIFDSKNATSSIKLFEKNGVSINDNVYLLTGTLWNSGDLPISKSDVRKSLVLEIGGAKRILDYKITKQKDASVSNFRLQSVTINSLKIDWDYFDPNFGFRFQVIYSGNENPNFDVTGKVLDISNIKKLSQSLNGNSWFSYIFISICSIIVMVSFLPIYKMIRQKRFVTSYLTLLMYFTISLAYLGVLIYFLVTRNFLNNQIPL